MKYVWILCLLIISSCNIVKEDNIVQEDYEKLFPPKEIEKPENKRGELHVQLCDPDLALKDYKYPGTELPEEADQYQITLVCSFREMDRKGELATRISSSYEVKYINAEKELVTISCGEKKTGASQSVPNVMYNGEELKISFKVHSGYPLYLSVSGGGPRSSSIKASIKAVSTDGLIEIPNLSTEQYQNEDGINSVRHPYCEYLILP